ncbi:MAG: DUF790 family protein [Oligoflexus sp.]
MLTKDLLKYSVRASKVHPKYVPVKDEANLEIAATLEAAFQDSVQQRYCEMKKNLSEVFSSPTPFINGLIKLLEDRCQFEEISEEVENYRWQVFHTARELRLKNSFSSRQQYAQELAKNMGNDVDVVRKSLYGDLPDQRAITDFRPYGAENLLHRYNCSQIQGLILRARYLDVELGDCSLVDKRRLFQKLKFHRLLVEVISEQPFRMRLSGPMSIFESSLTYGMRLANFFPYILLTKNWSIKAELRIDGRDLLLDLNSKRWIRSHYPSLSGHIPEEYQKFIDLFNKRSENALGWQAQAADDFLHLGKQSYCFPDFKLLTVDGRRIYVELFHRWHQHQLQQRLDSLTNESSGQLLIGICKSLKTDQKTDHRLKEMMDVGIKTFKFSGFPSPRAVLAQLS